MENFGRNDVANEGFTVLHTSTRPDVEYVHFQPDFGLSWQIRP